MTVDATGSDLIFLVVPRRLLRSAYEICADWQAIDPNPPYPKLLGRGTTEEQGWGYIILHAFKGVERVLEKIQDEGQLLDYTRFHLPANEIEPGREIVFLTIRAGGRERIALSPVGMTEKVLDRGTTDQQGHDYLCLYKEEAQILCRRATTDLLDYAIFSL